MGALDIPLRQAGLTSQAGSRPSPWLTHSMFAQEVPLRSPSSHIGDSMTSEVIEDEKQFYSKAKTYWKDIPPTVDGMLGGYGHISSIDISSSRKFLQRFLRVGRSGVCSGACAGAT